MTRIQIRRVNFWIAAVVCCSIIWGITLGMAQTRRRTRRPPVIMTETSTPTDPIASMPHKQKQQLLKSNLEKMRKDAAEMADLASSIQEDLEEVTENELPLRVVEKAEKVQKLAKRIKNTAKGP